jgi:hypothetical protein
MSTPQESKKSEDPNKLVKPEESPFEFYERLTFTQPVPPDEDRDMKYDEDRLVDTCIQLHLCTCNMHTASKLFLFVFVPREEMLVRFHWYD